MADAYTGTTELSNIKLAAYDTYLRNALRHAHIFRELVDSRPVSVNNPGESVVFSFTADMAVVTATLAETSDTDAVALANPSQVTVTLNEYGNSLITTARIRETAFSSVDMLAADKIAQNLADSVDGLVRTKAIAGTNVAYGGVRVARNTVLPTDVLTAGIVRRQVAALRNAAVQGRKAELFACVIHPDVSVDLREQTGTAGWRVPHEYQAGTEVWTGEIGTFEGAFFIETNRAGLILDGGGGGAGTKADVYPTLFLGKEALAEAVNTEPSIIAGPVVDRFRRQQPLGWYGFLGWSVFRQAAIRRVEVGSSLDPDYAA